MIIIIMVYLFTWSSAAGADLGLQQQQRSEHRVSLVLSECDVGIVVQTEYLRRVVDRQTPDVRHVSLTSNQITSDHSTGSY